MTDYWAILTAVKLKKIIDDDQHWSQTLIGLEEYHLSMTHYT